MKYQIFEVREMKIQETNYTISEGYYRLNKIELDHSFEASIGYDSFEAAEWAIRLNKENLKGKNLTILPIINIGWVDEE